MNLGLSILGLFTVLLALAGLFPVGEPTWFAFGLLAVGLFVLGAAFSGPHLRTAAPWGAGAALTVWALTGLGTADLSRWLGWAAFAFGMAYLGLGLLHFTQRVVPAGRLPRLLRRA